MGSTDNLSENRGTVAAIIRIDTFFQLEALDDLTWTSTKLGVVGTIESGCYLLAACLPGLRPLYLYVRKKGQFSSLRETKSSSLRKIAFTRGGTDVMLRPLESTNTYNADVKGPSNMLSRTDGDEEYLV